MADSKTSNNKKTIKKVKFTQREINKAIRELSKEVNKKATRRLFIEILEGK